MAETQIPSTKANDSDTAEVSSLPVLAIRIDPDHTILVVAPAVMIMLAYIPCLRVFAQNRRNYASFRILTVISMTSVLSILNLCFSLIPGSDDETFDTFQLADALAIYLWHFGSLSMMLLLWSQIFELDANCAGRLFGHHKLLLWFVPIVVYVLIQVLADICDTNQLLNWFNIGQKTFHNFVLCFLFLGSIPAYGIAYLKRTRKFNRVVLPYNQLTALTLLYAICALTFAGAQLSTPYSDVLISIAYGFVLAAPPFIHYMLNQSIRVQSYNMTIMIFGCVEDPPVTIVAPMATRSLCNSSRTVDSSAVLHI